MSRSRPSKPPKRKPSERKPAERIPPQSEVPPPSGGEPEPSEAAERASVREITTSRLRQWPLPAPDQAGDKESRGRILIVGGSREVLGAVILAGGAALRVGAGKLRLAVPGSVAFHVATAVPESRVFALPETAEGEVDPQAGAEVAALIKGVDAVVFGPGMIDEAAATALVLSALSQLGEEGAGKGLVLDAAALAALREQPELLCNRQMRAIATPHAGEMASYLGTSKETVVRHPLETARQAVQRFGCVVALKGAETLVVGAEGAYRNRAGNVGLATSGSGDVLAGLMGGLLARGAEPLQAAAWAVHLHGKAGDRLSQRLGGPGFLAREIAAEVPALIARLMAHGGKGE